MIGQWIADTEEETPASIRIDLEVRGESFHGHAYVFYPGAQLPGFLFDVRLPKMPPHRTTVTTIYLYQDGGVMSIADRELAVQKIAQSEGVPPPSTLDVEFYMVGESLQVNWAAPAGDDHAGSITLAKSDAGGESDLVGRPDLTTWDEFRQWAVSQHPHAYIFRGQPGRWKLATSFHRTWRKDLSIWITDDVTRLFGAVAEQLNYPLQLGNLQHNAAIWSILQHHGYPTPMLDWTYSPFVAAYFAFQSAAPDSLPRIYIFDQAQWNLRYGKAQFVVDAAPNQLTVVESMQVANPRHGPQQAISAVTNVADVEGFIRRREKDDGITYLTVCDLPETSKPQIMRELELMGITYGSLFPGLDGICRDMKDRLFASPLPNAS